MPVKKRLDVLDDFCGSESDEGSDAEDGPGPAKKRATAPKVTVQALERAGYQSGPSVLHVPEQRAAEPESTWDWSKGDQHDRDASPTPEVCTVPYSLRQYGCIGADAGMPNSLATLIRHGSSRRRPSARSFDV